MNMGRGRLNMELIANERSRKTTFQKRRKGIMKKAYEFSTLCEVDMCMIIYGPKLNDRPPELQTWPQNTEEVNRIINKYKDNTMRKPAKKTFDLSDLLMDRKNKVYADIYRARKEMYESKYPTWDEGINSFTENQLETLLNVLDAKLDSGKRTLLSKRKDVDHHQLVMKEASENKMLQLSGNPRNINIVGDSSSQKQRYIHYTHEDQKPVSSLNNIMVDMQPFPVSFDHHHHLLSDQMLQFDNSDQCLNNLMAPNPGPMAMWMLESNYNYSLQYGAGATSSTSSQLPLNDPMIQYSTLENRNMNMMMLNSNNSTPPCSSSTSQYYARLMQPVPLVPYMQYPMMPPSVSSHQVQVHASQVKDDQYDEVNQYLVMNNKMI